MNEGSRPGFMENTIGRIWYGFCIQFCTLREPIAVPLYPAKGLPSKVDEFESAGYIECHQNRVSKEQERVVLTQGVSKGEQR